MHALYTNINSRCALSVLIGRRSWRELKLAYGDSMENVASLQDCHTHQSDSVQTLGNFDIF